MANRFPRAIGLALFLALILTLPALAGGWAVITLDQWPGVVDPSAPLKIGFVVRQHGISPMQGLEPTITFRNPDTGESFAVQATPEGDTGHYTAVFSFPSTGTWEWSIQAFTMDQPMPPLNVAGIEQPVTQAGQNAPAPTLLVGILGLTVTSAGLILAFRRRNRLGYALVAIGLFTCAAGLIMMMNRTALAQSGAASPSTFTAQQQLGEDLFIAKGCVTCHNNSRVKYDGNIFIGVGPDLTKFQADPDYLRSWLKDPKSIKPATEMPDLGLHQDEIEALIAFINTEPGK